MSKKKPEEEAPDEEAAATEDGEGEAKSGDKSAPASPSKKVKPEDAEEPADPTKEYKLGVYSHEGKHMLKNPKTTSMSYNSNASFLMMGTSDGTVVLRPAKYARHL